MKTTAEYMELYTDYLIGNSEHTTATGLSAMMDKTVTHDQITRFLSLREFDSKGLWKMTKKTTREIESGDGCLIFDDTVQEKAWTDASETMCYHFDYVSTIYQKRWKAEEFHRLLKSNTALAASPTKTIKTHCKRKLPMLLRSIKGIL